MNRRATTVVLAGTVIGIVVLLAIYMGMIVTGVIDTRPGELVIVAKDAQKAYDGEPLSSTEYEIKSGSLKKGHKIVATSTASQREVGSRENSLKISIVDSLGADVTSHYNVEVKSGLLTVTPCRLVLRSGSTQKVYDGIPLEYGFWELVSGTVPDGVNMEVVFSAAQTKPGQCKNDFAAILFDDAGRNVTRNFQISYLCGTLTVTKRPLIVTSYGSSKVYDGEELRYEEYTVDGEVLSEHYLEVLFPAAITNVGSVTNNMIVSVQSGYGDVSDCYEITVRVGKLEVTPRPIEISATPCIKNYMPDELPTGAWYLTKGSLVAGHELKVVVEAVKNSQNTVEFILRNVYVYESMDIPGGALLDVTNNYEITLVHGIDRDNLFKLSAASASKSAPYNGQPLRCEQYALTSGTLMDGHRLEAMFTGSQTEIGMSANTFTLVVINEQGEDVTYQYDITYEYGTLEVYANVPQSGGEISDDGGISQGGAQNQSAIAARLRAQSSGRVYLRFKSYGDYVLDAQSGTYKWAEAVAYPLAEQSMLLYLGKVLAADGRTPVGYEIELRGNQFLLPNYVADGIEGSTSDVYLPATQPGYALSGYAWNYSYADALRLAPDGIGDTEMQAYTSFVYSQYLNVPQSTREVLAELAEQNGLRADHLSIIEDVAAYIRTAAEYDVSFTPCPEGQDEVVYFLTEGKGVCRHFASAATLMYRTLGIPARYVVGYSVYAAGQTWTDVTGAQAHAWVEVFVPGLGWVRMDVTPSASGADSDALVVGLSKVMGYYTGLPYYATEQNAVIVSGALQSGHSIAYVAVSGSRTEAGTGVSTITEIRIEDGDGNDVTSKYHIVLQDGIIDVRKPVLNVYASSAKRVYDGTELTAPTFTYSFANTPLGGLYTVTASVIGAQTEVGESANVADGVCVVDPLGRDITENFEIRTVPGTLKVYLYELSISTESATKVYDGKPLSAQALSYDADALAARGHELVYSLPEIGSVGSVYNTPTWRIVDADGVDVSAQYLVSVHAGTLRIKPVELTVQVESAEKVYDGKPLQVKGYALISGELVPGQRIASYRITGSQTNVGESEAGMIGIMIVDESGRDVSANYLINVVPGKLLVTAP